MRSVMRRIFFCFLSLTIFALAASAASAQEIQGQVRYADTQQSAIGVLVRCDGTGGVDQRMTDRNGKFYFRVSPGHYTVTVRVPGYREEGRSLDLIDTRQSEYIFITLRVDTKNPAVAKTKAPVGDAPVPAEAEKEFEKAEAAFTSDAKNATEEGIAHLEKALAIYPTFVRAQLRLGTAYMDLKQWDKAEQALRKTLEIDPKAANAFFALGETYIRQKKYDQAEKALQDGLAIETRSAQAHLTLARAYWEKVAGVKDEAQWRPPLEKAYSEVNLALQLDPTLAGAHLLKGNLYFKVYRYEDAQHEYEEYLRLDPKGPAADQTRALVEKIKKGLAEQKNP